MNPGENEKWAKKDNPNKELKEKFYGNKGRDLTPSDLEKIKNLTKSKK